MKTAKSHLLRACKGVSHHHLRLADTQSQAKGRENFTVAKGKAAGMA